MANYNFKGLGFARQRTTSAILSHPIYECALWMSHFLFDNLCVHSIGLGQGHIVSITRGLPPPRER